LTKILQIPGLCLDFLAGCPTPPGFPPSSLFCPTAKAAMLGRLAGPRGVEHLHQGSRLCRASAAAWQCTRLSAESATAGIHSEEHSWFPKYYILAFLTEFHLYRNRWEKTAYFQTKVTTYFEIIAFSG